MVLLGSLFPSNLALDCGRLRALLRNDISYGFKPLIPNLLRVGIGEWISANTATRIRCLAINESAGHKPQGGIA